MSTTYQSSARKIQAFGKTVLITGASGGIGLAMTKLFLKERYRVIAHYRSSGEVLRKMARQTPHLRLVRGDFSTPAGISAFLKNCRRIESKVDIVINNAGLIPAAKPLENLKEKDISLAINVNYLAPFLLSQAYMPGMIHVGWGRIINISSVGVKFGGSPASAHYSAAKAALEALTRSFSKDGAPFGVCVNTLRAGVIDTAIHDGIPGKRMKARKKLIPLGRLGTPEEVAEAALFLASDKASFVSGTILEVTGGE